MKNINVDSSVFLRYGEFIQRKGHNDKEMDPRMIKSIKDGDSIHLTFDFCPTNEIDKPVIDWLIDNKIKATLFVGVEWLKRNEDKDLSFLDNPLFQIGGHGYHHVDPLEQSTNEQIEDIDKCLDFWSKRGKEIKWYRVPYGHPTDDALLYFEKKMIKCASWVGPVLDKKSDHVHSDITKHSKEFIENYVKKGDILIMHANGEGIKTLEILDILKNIASKKGFSFNSLK